MNSVRLKVTTKRKYFCVIKMHILVGTDITKQMEMLPLYYATGLTRKKETKLQLQDNYYFVALLTIIH